MTIGPGRVPVDRAGRVAGQILLTAAATVGACCLLLAISGLAFGVRPLIFRSGSMSPTIPAGSLALSRQIPADRIRVGDIVSVPAGGTRVTHRVVQVTVDGAVATLELRGDANNAPDQEHYRVSSADRVWFAVPVLGTVIAWLSRPPGVFVLAGYAAIMLTLIVRRTPRRDPDDHDRSDDHDRADDREAHEARPAAGSRARTGLARAAAASCAGTMAVTIFAVPSWAAWTDSVPVSGTTVAAHTIPVPANFTCAGLGLASLSFSWTAVPEATSYTVHYGSSTADTTSTSYTTPALLAGGTAYVTANHNYGSTTWTSANSNTRNYTVAVIALCA